ncbi:hypothetical protein JDV02_008364 [Purpureocillium takamizusanense]|uniref:Uncharacterized protein n=1 Tax=Purpureocillium takamizusanense TaxID=2060973 RepID=A0A9Q8VEM7_9HYPO|nr:uncharacterized protein JDV02_008364 [Purpureocillium takamizusanense]UNI22476.1 hypothetical protein JDV02_008364 [Purpureocillium takamizusanense]
MLCHPFRVAIAANLGSGYVSLREAMLASTRGEQGGRSRRLMLPRVQDAANPGERWPDGDSEDAPQHHCLEQVQLFWNGRYGTSTMRRSLGLMPPSVSLSFMWHRASDADRAWLDDTAALAGRLARIPQ